MKSIVCCIFITASVIAFGNIFIAQGKSLRCSNSPVIFDFEKLEDFECLCQAVTKAVSILQTMHLQASECISVKLSEGLISEESHDLFGAYHPRAREIRVLSYAQAKSLYSEQELASEFEMTKDLWCSFAAHELAHAVINQNRGKLNLSRVEEEYIAYVTQLLVMTKETRAKFMETYGDIEAYKSREQMSETYFLLDPNRFAAKCYLHYLSLNAPEEFIAELSE